MNGLLFSDKKGKIYTHPRFEALGMEAGTFFRLSKEDLVRLPFTGRLFMLPHRMPVAFDPENQKTLVLEDRFAVAAFLPPGYTVTHNSAYIEAPGAAPLPLFSYAAVIAYKNNMYAAAVKIDSDRRHDSALVDIEDVKKNIRKFKKVFAHNRLIAHLERCSLVYGCPNAQNFFLSRYEAPLPTSPSCNASCSGCISYQAQKDICETQPRIKFVPTPKEISEIAIFHIGRVKDAIVSFGQGCEGEGLLQAKIIEGSIRLIRKKTSKGTVNINTNGSRPDAIARLFDAGLDSVRISLNSARETYYTRYYKPRGYSFKDVLRSIKVSKEARGFVSLNYLTMPGFTDSSKEFSAVKKLIRKYKVDMIQWRNLNYDPVRYFEVLKVPVAGRTDLVGIRQVIDSIRKEFPHLKMGYFNPRAAAFRRRSRHG
jgi:pyruvate-formate lyase-activating enzyme